MRAIDEKIKDTLDVSKNTKIRTNGRVTLALDSTDNDGVTGWNYGQIG